MLRRVHNRLVSLGVYGVVLTSGLCAALLLARVAYTGQGTFLMLGWNLLLAWIPFGLSVLLVLSASAQPRARWALVPPLGAAWLVFLPNAPYLLTNLIHLQQRPPVPYWYDIAMLGLFACSGLLLGVRSLEHVHDLIRRRFGELVGWASTGCVAMLCGLGMYLGRFDRWNSWDLISQPHAIAADVLRRALDPMDNPGAWGFTLVMGGSLLAFYIAMRQDRDSDARLRHRAVGAGNPLR